MSLNLEQSKAKAAYLTSLGEDANDDQKAELGVLEKNIVVLEKAKDDPIMAKILELEQTFNSTIAEAADMSSESGGEHSKMLDDLLQKARAAKEQQLKVAAGSKMKFEQAHRAAERAVTKDMIESVLDRKPMTEEARLSHKYANELLTASTVLHAIKKHDNYEVPMHLCIKQMANDPYFKEMVASGGNNAILKAMDTATSTEGAEWAPANYSSELIDQVRYDTYVASLFPVYNMPRDEVVFPVLSADMTAYLVSETTTDNAELTAGNRVPASKPTTGSRTMTAVKLGQRIDLSQDLVEDAIVPLLDEIMMHIRTVFSESLDSAIINGDTSTTHMDSNVTASTDVRKGFVGLRKTGSTNEVDCSTFTFDNLMSVLSAMGVYGARFSDIAWIVGPKVNIKLMNLYNANNESVLMTMDKFGQNASAINGMIGKLASIPVVLTGEMPENLNASGVYDGSTTDNASMLAVYRPGFRLGMRRALKIKSADIIETDAIRLVGLMKNAFFHRYASTSGSGLVGQAYNIAV